MSGWIGVHLVQDVPEDIAACEFDCSKTDCEGAELINCERRVRAEAAEQRVRDGAALPNPQLEGGEQPSKPGG